MRIRVTVVLGLVSVGVIWGGLAVSKEVPSGPTIKLERAVHFLSPDGADTVLTPGVYRIEAKDEKVINVTAVDGGEMITIQAEAGTHEQQLSAPEALTVAQEEDLFHVVLLMPGGKTLDALGTFSGVSTRAPRSMVPLRSLMPRPVNPVFNCVAPTGPGTTHASVTAAQTWTAAASPHVLPYDINISAPVTIEPCAVVRIAAGRTITILNPNGALIAAGAPGSAITIEPQVAGMAWASIRNMGGTLSLTHAVVRGGGHPLTTNPAYAGTLNMQSSGAVGTLHVDDVEIAGSLSQGIYINGDVGFDATSQKLYIHGSAGYPVHVVARVIGTIPSGAYADNGHAAIAIAGSGGPVRDAQTMHDRGVPYHIGSGQDGGRMDVSTQYKGPAAVLTILPGVTMLFPPGGSLNINASNYGGALIAVGTPIRPIVFTSDKGRASASGDWLGIGFDGQLAPQSVMQYVRVEFAGAPRTAGSYSCPYPNRPGPNDAAIRISGPPSMQFITNTEIFASAHDGIDRGWRANVITDFLATNTFTAVAGCKQTMPSTLAGVCPMSVPCP